MSEPTEPVEVTIYETGDRDPWRRFRILSKPSYTLALCGTRTEADIVADALRAWERIAQQQESEARRESTGPSSGGGSPA